MILMNLVRENYSKLNNNDLRIYSYIIQNKSEANELNINQMADEVAVMYSGQIVEQSPVEYIFKRDITDYNHPYTVALLNSIPSITSDRNERLDIIPGSVPHPLNLPKGCKFADRCKFATKKCIEEMPDLVSVNENQKIRCHYPNRKEREENAN